MFDEAGLETQARKFDVFGIAANQLRSHQIIWLRRDRFNILPVKCLNRFPDSAVLPVRRKGGCAIIDTVDEEAVVFMECRTLTKEGVDELRRLLSRICGLPFVKVPRIDVDFFAHSKVAANVIAANKERLTADYNDDIGVK